MLFPIVDPNDGVNCADVVFPKATVDEMVAAAAVVDIVPKPPKDAVLVLWGGVCPPEENCSALPLNEEPPNTALVLLGAGAGAEVVEPPPNSERVEELGAAVEPPGAASNSGLKLGGGLVSAAVVETLNIGLNPEDGRGALEEGAEVRGRLKTLAPEAEVVVVEVEGGGTKVDRVRLGCTGAVEAGAAAGAGDGLFLFKISSSSDVSGGELTLTG